MKVYETPRRSVIKYESATYTKHYFFEAMDGAYGRAKTSDNQDVYLPPLTEVDVVSTVTTFEEFQELYKGK